MAFWKKQNHRDRRQISLPGAIEAGRQIRKYQEGGAWAAQLVNCSALDFGLGHDLTVCEVLAAHQAPC